MVGDIVWNFYLGAHGVAAGYAGVARVEGCVVDAFAFGAVLEAFAWRGC